MRPMGRIHFRKRLCLGLLISLLCLGQHQHIGKSLEEMLDEAYLSHFAQIREELPRHSGMPPLLDLSKEKVDDAKRDSSFETIYKTSMGSGPPLNDPGVSRPAMPTSHVEAIIDSVGPKFVWLVTFSAAIIIAEPIAADTLLSRDRRLIYSRYSLKIVQVLKNSRKSGLVEGSEVVAFAPGGSVRFPSGHLLTFLLVGDGFPEIGKRYAIFLSKIRDSKAYILGMTFLLQGDSAFSIERFGGPDATPRQVFESQLRLAIKEKRNVE